MLVVEPRPRRNWHRYTSEQMSGPLPPILFKYLPGHYAETMVGRGDVMFSTLAWFQNYEDEQRGDRFEGTRKYFPVGGLEVTRTERDGKAHPPVSFKAPGESLQSRAKGHNHIFIYSTSLQSDLTFDGADACVEIYDPVKFATRLQAALKRHRSVRSETLIHDQVKYYDFEAPPDNVWALPHLLALHKHRAFSSQHEYRFAFGIRRNVFNFEHVDCFVVRDDETFPIRKLESAHHRKVIRIGPLADCCRIV
ncbi:MAG: hypothetical protein WD690_19695 [Vicinamibacterales bacterium]